MGNLESFEKVRQSVVSDTSTIHNIDLSIPLQVHKEGFGDTWMRLCYIINACKVQNKTATICWGSGRCSYCLTKSYESKNTAIGMAIKLLDGGHLLKQIAEQSGDKLSMNRGDFYTNNYCPTKQRWNCDCNSRRVCYQFDGRAFPQKRFTKTEEIKLLDGIKRAGYKVVNCGGEQPLENIVNALSDCVLFVGVASGIALISLSVGTPTHIVLNDIPARAMFQDYNNKPLNYHINYNYFLNELPKKIPTFI